MSKHKESCETCYCNDEGFCHLNPPRLITYEVIAQDDDTDMITPILGYPKITNTDWCMCWISRAKRNSRHLHSEQHPHTKHPLYD